ncbi:protein C13 [BeAn 58058 virus]|uniref:protein C13 n=1 Tax=BeAn 58058 virus TaxID=67082 RepID=UPI000909F171|nr:protein C13 [BeAn 58058 virus]APG58192.1 protein C13 [BeAn 58058 virus]
MQKLLINNKTMKQVLIFLCVIYSLCYVSTDDTSPNIFNHVRVSVKMWNLNTTTYKLLHYKNMFERYVIKNPEVTIILTTKNLDLNFEYQKLIPYDSNGGRAIFRTNYNKWQKRNDSCIYVSIRCAPDKYFNKAPITKMYPFSTNKVIFPRKQERIMVYGKCFSEVMVEMSYINTKTTKGEIADYTSIPQNDY